MAEPDTPSPATPPAHPIGPAMATLRLYIGQPRDPADSAPVDLHRGAYFLPLAGALVGLAGAGVGGLAYLAGLSTTLAAILCTIALLIVTGARHEDGIARCCEGLFGEATPETRIVRLRERCLGTLGTAGVSLAILLRVFALTELFRLIGPAGLLVLVGVAVASRPLALLPALALPPAPTSAPPFTLPRSRRAVAAMVLGGGLALACAWPGELVAGMAAALVVAFLVMFGVTRLVATKIGGYTQAVMAAGVTAAEVAMLLVLSAAANWHGPV